MNMPDQPLSPEERSSLLELAREAIELGVRGQPLPKLDYSTLPAVFVEPGATFVTLTCQGELRGCIGALEAYQPLVEDVREHAIAAALQDYRFLPMQPEEVSEVRIEISRLSRPVILDYLKPADLQTRLRVGIDGVILKDGIRRATFLPQVWEKIPDPFEFLSNLCYKMGVAPDLWMHKKLEVFTYQVEEFHE